VLAMEVIDPVRWPEWTACQQRSHALQMVVWVSAVRDLGSLRTLGAVGLVRRGEDVVSAGPHADRTHDEARVPQGVEVCLAAVVVVGRATAVGHCPQLCARQRVGRTCPGVSILNV
jgi:hypothetical protein